MQIAKETFVQWTQQQQQQQKNVLIHRVAIHLPVFCTHTVYHAQKLPVDAIARRCHREAGFQLNLTMRNPSGAAQY
ncbi:hypothetical protein F2P81_023452 [Scophthalmus maximus]|uniref:Uncharacterized protein n=1 Tax=Scophthalmus maximus TaxID=52904 RepID=A0A6A4RZ78_SCOMX|nr:hypothetical protein F2P81_023452 [Scophthalmus maximus]